MGGKGNLLMPVPARAYSSFGAHTRRVPKSREPGTDMFVPKGTPVIAPADGRIHGWGDSIGPATGRHVGLDFENGMGWRSMHHERLTLSRTFLNNRGFVRAGTTIAISGASGYGYEDWSHLPGMPGPHTHVTLWPTWAQLFGYRRDGSPYSIDFMDHVASSGGAFIVPDLPTFIPFWKRPYGQSEEQEMLCIQIKDGRGLLGPVGKTRTYTVGGMFFVETTDHPTANDASAIIQRYDSTGALMGVPNCTYRELYDYAKGSCALTADELAPYKSAAGL